MARPPATELTYPSARVLTSTYDALYRRQAITGVAAWEFAGPGRVALVTLANGMVCSHLNDARTRSAVQAGMPVPDWNGPCGDRLGYDGAGRLIAKRYFCGQQTTIKPEVASVRVMA